MTTQKTPAKSRAKRATSATRSSQHKLTLSGLTVEQEAYCRARASGMNIGEAVLACGAGFSRHTAGSWERENVKVRQRIDELAKLAQQNAILRSGLNREWVIRRYMSVVERCMQAEPVYDKKGEPTGEYTFNAAGANQALRALGDVLGLFKPMEKAPGDEYEHLSDEEIARIATELAAQAGVLEAPARAKAAQGREQAGALPPVSQAD